MFASQIRTSMDSDSDSDGSHISTTPPRDLQPPSANSWRPHPPPNIPSNNSRVRIEVSTSSRSKPKPKPSLKPKPSRVSVPVKPPKADPPHSVDRSPLFSAEVLPFQIRLQSSNQERVVSLIEALPAGFFSKSASFTRKQRCSLSFDPVDDGAGSPSEAILQSKAEINSSAAWLPEELKEDDSNGVGSSVGAAKRYSNLIGGTAPLLPSKIRKCGGGGEGNFVKLNLKRGKRKFLNRRGGHSSSSSRPYKRYKKKPRTGGKDGAQTESVCEEDGSVAETAYEQKQKQKEKKLAKSDPESIEEAISAARNDPSDENLGKVLSITHGYNSFRDGQLEAIKLVLGGKSSMLVLPTGAGKSLCYQLPAMILPGITLVISPLVALMIDQLKQLPSLIRGGLFCSSQTQEEASETVQLLKQGEIKVLFVSPERFLNAEFLLLFSATVFISLVVVDEAHCISEWSHNFRPSYMRLRASLLKEKLNVGCVLAMTATATTTTLRAVMSALEIPEANLIQKAQMRENFQLSVSSSKNRMKDLLALMKSSTFKEVRSIIIYCKFQYETDMISRYLSDNNISAKNYHSGLFAKDRNRVQELFCTNKIRVVVATVAFGMGLDKSDIGAVIHYSLPESLEEYVQEIGRAGRDGRLSYCHLFLDDETYFKLRSLMFSDGVDQYAVDKFLHLVFTNEKKSKGGVCSLIKESASRKYDMKDEVMFTLLTQLELGEVQYLRLLPQMNVTCTLSFHKTSPDVLAERNIVVAEILQKSEMKQGEYVFDTPTVANGIGITTSDLSTQLQNLKFKGEVTYELKDLAYCYTIAEVPADLCSLSAHLTKWLSEVESCKVQKLDAMYNAASVAVNSCEKLHGCSESQHTPCLQRRISDYFNEKQDDNNDHPNKMCQSSPFLRADIKVFLQSNAQAKFTPRAVARILHGVASPAYSSQFWSKAHFWGRYVHMDFPVVMEAAKAELINLAKKNAV